jgi:hypothetical protein
MCKDLGLPKFESRPECVVISKEADYGDTFHWGASPAESWLQGEEMTEKAEQGIAGHQGERGLHTGTWRPHGSVGSK